MLARVAQARAALGSGARRLVATLWVGSLWAIGYVAAPTLFANVDSTLAGQMVGHMLRTGAWVSIACALVMLVLLRLARRLDAGARRSLYKIVGAMLVCTLVVYLGLQPIMAQMRDAAGPGGVRNSPMWTQFAILHGVSQLVYVIESVLGAVLVVKTR
jgi:hypothetical protein